MTSLPESPTQIPSPSAGRASVISPIAVALVFGIALEWTAFVGQHTAQGRVVGGVAGGVVLVIGVYLLVTLRLTLAPKFLVLDTDGISWTESPRRSWRVDWTELDAVECGTRLPPGRDPLRAPYWLDFIPGDSGFAGRHRNIHLVRRPAPGERNRAAAQTAAKYRHPFRIDLANVPALNQALAHFAGPRHTSRDPRDPSRDPRHPSRDPRHPSRDPRDTP